MVIQYKPAGVVQIAILIALNNAKRDGKPGLEKRELPHSGYGLKGLISKRYIKNVEGDLYAITEWGVKAMINPDAAPEGAAGDDEPEPRPSLRSQIRPVPPPVTTNGHTPTATPVANPPFSVASVSHCSDSCPHKRVLEIIAPYVPEAAQMLALIESIEKRNSK